MSFDDISIAVVDVGKFDRIGLWMSEIELEKIAVEMWNRTREQLDEAQRNLDALGHGNTMAEDKAKAEEKVKKEKEKWGKRELKDDGQIMQCKRLETFCKAIADELRSGRRVALGIEAPLWMPTYNNVRGEFTYARSIDGKRSWSAAAGATVTTVNMAFLPALLKQIQGKGSKLKATLKPEKWEPGTLLIWEAFVSGDCKGVDDDADAARAGEKFRQHLQECKNGPKKLVQTKDCPLYEDVIPFSLAAAALQFAGWECVDENPFEQQALIIKA